MKSVRQGAAPGEAAAAVVLVHGRGGSPEDMLGLAAVVLDALGDASGREGLAWEALRAPGGFWYPHGFMEPLERNRPWLDRSLEALDGTIADLTGEGIAEDRIGLLAFSQGACLALEHAARGGRRLGGVIGLSGGLIGPPGTPRDYPDSLDGTPVFLGCSDCDPHIPEGRVRETAEVLAGLEARVTTRIYPGMGHTVNDDEIEAAAGIVRSLLAEPEAP